MLLVTTDAQRVVDLGASDIWRSFCATIEIRLADSTGAIPKLISLIHTGTCDTNDAIETARQCNLARDMLARFAPEEAVYDPDDPSVPAPWIDNLSPVITSCANLYVTADGKDLFTELVNALTYSGYTGNALSVFPE